MQQKLATDAIFGHDNYYVELAMYTHVTSDWDQAERRSKDNPNGMSALYYRTDTDGGRAVLHMIDGELELLPGRVYFIPAYSVVCSELKGGEMDKYFIHFRANSLGFGLYRHLSKKYSIAANAQTEILFKTVIENYKKNSTDAKMRVRGSMDLLLADFFTDLRIERRNVERFQSVLSYIDEHFRENISISKMADLMHVTTVYFSNSFKRAFHISPKQYIMGLRLNESQRLLLNTDMSVKDIAHAVGFDNENYFSEFFTSKIGVSALKFRRRAFKNSQK